MAERLSLMCRLAVQLALAKHGFKIQKALLQTQNKQLSAYRNAQEQRNEGCEHCSLDTHQTFDCDSCHLVKDKCDNQEDSCYGQMYIQIENKFCPMCGRKLKEG